MAARPDSEAWRAFLAIELPEAVRKNLRPVVDSLEPLKDVVRPNGVDRIHLTLHFLGQLPVARVEALKAAVASTVAAQRRFAVDAEGVGAFPNFGRAEVVWAGIGGAERPLLMSLQAETRKALATMGLALEDRFHPHLTLARVRRPIRGPLRAVLKQWEGRWNGAHFGTIPVDALTLFRSELGAGPPHYSTIATFELQ